MLGQPSCDIPHSKSSSQMLNQAHRHSTPLYSGTVQKQGHRTFPRRWNRKPSQSVHQVLASHKSGTIQVHDWTIGVQFSGSVETE